MENILPGDFWDGFEPFLKLNTDKKKQLIEEVSNIDFKISEEIVSVFLAEKIGIPKDEIGNAIQHFAGLIIIKEASQVEIAQFIQDIITGLLQIYKERTDLSINSEEMTNLLQVILNTGNKFYVTVKSKELNQERERLLSNVRILTDLRPVFTDGESCDFKKISIIHTLKVVYQEGDKSHERFFAIDNIDLRKIKSQVDRALEKEKKLKEKFNGNIV
jgi:hypothetical protein